MNWILSIKIDKNTYFMVSKKAIALSFKFSFFLPSITIDGNV